MNDNGIIYLCACDGKIIFFQTNGDATGSEILGIKDSKDIRSKLSSIFKNFLEIDVNYLRLVYQIQVKNVKILDPNKDKNKIQKLITKLSSSVSSQNTVATVKPFVYEKKC
ncbi:MAG: hypothetical protein AMS24_00510 [Chlamydiae bacterium SM23_39]|nr:MAG: hypothetical protein AMS24_00510 [Chlamydiae bacterium SM23_39]